jgi:hypothetical protein
MLFGIKILNSMYRFLDFQNRRLKPKFRKLKPQIPRISTDFEGVIGNQRTNLFVAKLSGHDNRSLLYPCNLRNLRLNPFSVFGLKVCEAAVQERPSPQLARRFGLGVIFAG